MATYGDLVTLAHQRQNDTGDENALLPFLVARSVFGHREADPDPAELPLWPGGPVAVVNRRMLGNWHICVRAADLLHGVDGVDPRVLPPLMLACTGRNSDGGWCGRHPTKGSTECAAHSQDPEKRAAFQAAQVRGLLAAQSRDRSTGQPVADMPHLEASEGRVEALQRAYVGMMNGSVSVAKAKGVAVLVRAAAEEVAPDKLGALEAQVADLLAEVNRRERRASWE